MRRTRPNAGLTFSHGDRIEIFPSTGSEVLLFDDLWRDRCLVSVSVAVGDLGELSEFHAPFVSKAHLMQLKQEAIDDPARKEKRE
jgi:hypothetical protein